MTFQIEEKLSPAIRIWIAEDDVELREILGGALARRGREVLLFENGQAVLEALQGESYDLLVTDLMMPGIDGIQLLNEAKQAHPEGIVIIMTGYASLDTAIKAIRGGAYDYIRKPFKLEELEIVIQNACEKISLVRENRGLLRMLEETKEELRHLKETWDEHLSNVLAICWRLFGEKRDEGIGLILKQATPLAPALDPGEKGGEEKALESLERLTRLRRERSITDEEFSTFKKILLRKLNGD